MSEDAEDQLKKKLKEIDLENNDIIMFFDGLTIQNTPNTDRTLCKKGKKNIAINNPLKFKINTLEAQAIKWKFTPNYFKFVKST